MLTSLSSFFPRVAVTVTLTVAAVAAIVSAGCVSTQNSQTPQDAARNCKAVLADFPNRPKTQPTAAEQAEARLALGRFAAERGGTTGIGNNMVSDLNRDCY